MVLIVAIKTHLEQCSNDQANFTESQREYLESAFESLENVIEESESEVQIAAGLNLRQVWDSATAAAAKKKNDLSWEDFVKKIEEKDFFRGIALGGRQYVDRLKKAKAKYQMRHGGAVPDFDKEPTEAEKSQAEELKKQNIRCAMEELFRISIKSPLKLKNRRPRS